MSLHRKKNTRKLCLQVKTKRALYNVRVHIFFQLFFITSNNLPTLKSCTFQEPGQSLHHSEKQMVSWHSPKQYFSGNSQDRIAENINNNNNCKYNKNIFYLSVGPIEFLLTTKYFANVRHSILASTHSLLEDNVVSNIFSLH